MLYVSRRRTGKVAGRVEQGDAESEEFTTRYMYTKQSLIYIWNMSTIGCNMISIDRRIPLAKDNRRSYHLHPRQAWGYIETTAVEPVLIKPGYIPNKRRSASRRGL